MDVIEKMATEHKNAYFNFGVEKARELNQMINEIDNELKPGVIRESDFKTYLLPILVKQVELTEENIKRFIHNVLQITNNNIKHPIRVYDDNLNELLFELPPFMLNMDERSGIFKMINFNQLVGEFISAKENPITEVEANKKLGGAMKELDTLIAADKQEMEYYLKEIYKMYVRYNFIKDDALVSETKNKNINNDNLVDDDLFDYDD